MTSVAGDQLLADSVDGRVGDLGEKLLEVIVQQPGLIGEHGQGRIVAHRADWLDGVLGHGPHHHPQGFVGIAKGLLALHNPFVVGFRQQRCIRQSRRAESDTRPATAR